MTRRNTKKEQLHAYLAAKALARIAEAEWQDLLDALAPVSERQLRRLLWEEGIPVKQPFAGIRQDTFDHLEESLLAMSETYEAALASGNRGLARQCRRVVILSKDHARLAAQNPKTHPAVREMKREMVEWMLVWLGDPSVFPVWVELRRRAGLPPTPTPPTRRG